jgi:hypothetical protein
VVKQPLGGYPLRPLPEGFTTEFVDAKEIPRQEKHQETAIENQIPPQIPPFH